MENLRVIGMLTGMTKILLVDDENLILYSLGATLRRDGSEVTAVANGKDALSEIRRLTYDICFLDVNLPDANGLDLMKTVQQISPATRIVIMTAVDLNNAQMSYLHNNACHFLPKPFNLDNVRSLVDTISRTDGAASHEA
jgi:DNA-binding NtrC family response regulator